MSERSTCGLLADHAELMNKFGPDSARVSDFVGKHAANTEFVSLAYVAMLLKKALCERPTYRERENVRIGLLEQCTRNLLALLAHKKITPPMVDGTCERMQEECRVALGMNPSSGDQR